MSSATTIKKDTGALPSSAAGQSRVNAGSPSAASNETTFRPWHFFVLASLMAATAAVMLSRQATPEHLILVSLTITAAGLAATGFYRTLSPLAAPDLPGSSEPLSDRTRAALEREKRLTLRSIKELEFDRAMGKLSAKDFDELVGRLRSRAVALIKQLDAGESGYRIEIERELQDRLRRGGPAVAARTNQCACGTANDADAVFCKRCGTRLG